MAFRNSCYKFVTVKANWDDAEEKCLADGAELVVIESAEENTFLRRHILSNVHLKTTVLGKKIVCMCLKGPIPVI